MGADPIMVLVGRARQALHWTQRELGEQLGASHRTASRWEAGRSSFDAVSAERLARHVYAVDRGLASQLASAIGQSLVSLGIEAPPPPPAAPPAPVALPPVASPLPPAPRPAAMRDLIESVVCAVADAADVAPKVVRPAVLLTLRRAHEVGLDLGAASEANLLQPTLEAARPTRPGDLTDGAAD
jgi:transcriptional regulator with XRE-family HTH domain